MVEVISSGGIQPVCTDSLEPFPNLLLSSANGLLNNISNTEITNLHYLLSYIPVQHIPVSAKTYYKRNSVMFCHLFELCLTQNSYCINALVFRLPLKECSDVCSE